MSKNIANGHGINTTVCIVDILLYYCIYDGVLVGFKVSDFYPSCSCRPYFCCDGVS